MALYSNVDAFVITFGQLISAFANIFHIALDMKFTIKCYSFNLSEEDFFST